MASRRLRDRAPTAQAQKSFSNCPFDMDELKRAFSRCYQVIAYDIGSSGEVDEIDRYELFDVCIDQIGTNLDAPPGFFQWVVNTPRSDLLKLAEIVFPQSSYTLR